MEKYPVKRTDAFGRIEYIDWNGVERVIYRYWGDSGNVKVKCRLFLDDTSFDVYDVQGKCIASYSVGSFEVKTERFRVLRNGEISFVVEGEMLTLWKRILMKKE